MAQWARVPATESDDLRWTQGRNGMLEKEKFIIVPASGRSRAWSSEEGTFSTGEAFPNTNPLGETRVLRSLGSQEALDSPGSHLPISTE